jgi:hypothetical protein
MCVGRVLQRRRETTVVAVLLVPACLALLLVVLARIEPAPVRPEPAPPADGVAAVPVLPGQAAGLNVLVNTEK